MNMLLKMLGTAAVSVLLSYKVNYAVSVKDEKPKENTLKFFVGISGIVSGILYALIICGCIFLLKTSLDIVLVTDLIISLIVMGYIDFRLKIVPNTLNVALLISQAIANFVVIQKNADWLNIVMSGVLFAGLMLISRLSNEQIGMGDVKMLTVINLIYGLSYVVYVLIISMFITLIVCIPGLIMKKIKLKTSLPFVPFYALGTIVYTVLIYVLWR